MSADGSEQEALVEVVARRATFQTGSVAPTETGWLCYTVATWSGFGIWGAPMKS
jgi:hypothetical protein